MQNSRPESFVRKFGPKIFPREDFHVVNLTVIHQVILRCCARIAETLPVFNKARTEYYAGFTASVNRTQHSLFTVNITKKVKWRQNIRSTFFVKTFRSICLSRKDLHMVLLTVVADLEA